MSHSLRLRESRPLTVDRFPPPPKHSSQSAAKKVEKAEKARRALRFERTLPFRCIGWTAFSMGVGYALLFAFGATLRPLATSALLAHFLSGAALPTAWLSLVLARLPSLGLLSVAGLTRFSGGLTSALLCYRGLCDGAVLAAVLTLSGEIIDPRTRAAFLFWMSVGVILHLAVAISARSLAAYCATEPDAPPKTAKARSSRATLRYRIWRHATVSIAAAAACIVASLAYCAIIF